MRNYLTGLLLMTALFLRAANQDMKVLYSEIDEAIGLSPQYVADYEGKIKSVKDAYFSERNEDRRLHLAGQLFDMYKAYNNDSALTYIQHFIDHARAVRRADLAEQGSALMAFQCSSVGLYTEAIGILHKMDTHQLTQQGLVDYYVACMHVCRELAYYTRVPSMHDYYDRLKNEFRDSLFATADPDSEEYLLNKELQLLDAGKHDEAMKVNDRRMAKVKEGTREYAIVSYYRHLIYLAQDDRSQAMYWLAQSALCDIRGAIMDQASLISLAEQLNAEGDLERSYRYIRFTWDCNNRFNTRMRSWQISPILTVIEHSYEDAASRNRTILIATTIGMSILFLLVAGLLFYVLRQTKKLRMAESHLKETNIELAQLNSQMREANQKLSASNAQLHESNRIKEEYIGRFMSLCSAYINKLDDYRKMVNRKMKNKELEELFRISKSTELKEKELEELYQNFDSVFLRLFPNFVEEFNALLLPEAQIHPKEENRLSTDLRIFALIRLGFEDSSKIAEFLHYSVNTIYNYRARTKNGALGNREQFEREVKKLGMPKMGGETGET